MDPSEVRLIQLEDSEMIKSKDWRKALRAQPAYRIVNRTIRGQTQFISIVAIIGLVVLICLYLFPQRTNNASSVLRSSKYNYTYPLTSPVKTDTLHTFRIGVIADLDTHSKSATEQNVWFSYLLKGYLTYNLKSNSIVVTWDKNGPIRLISSYSLKGRGMELSELVVFDGRLLTFDDRTGLVFEIINDKAVPWVLLMDGDGKSYKGFKSEWACVKDEVLFVGSMGKEWTTSDGHFENNNPQFVKTISVKGQVTHISWIREYNRIRGVLDIHWPGYMTHESGVWSDVHRRWFFLPRRCSKEQYNESLDEQRGCSVLISANEGLYDVKVTRIDGGHAGVRGFASFKFLPFSQDTIIVALRTEELDGKTATYITCFTIEGRVLLNDFLIADLKYEGIEFI